MFIMHQKKNKSLMHQERTSFGDQQVMYRTLKEFYHYFEHLYTILFYSGIIVHISCITKYCKILVDT